MTFLGYIVFDKGVEVDPSKTKVVNNWPRHLTLTYIRRFLGLAGYYRRFVEGFSFMAYPLKTLTKKTVKLEWADTFRKNI